MRAMDLVLSKYKNQDPKGRTIAQRGLALFELIFSRGVTIPQGFTS